MLGNAKLEEEEVDGRPKQNVQEYLGSITRLQNSLNLLGRSNMRSADQVQAQMVIWFPEGVDVCRLNWLKLECHS